MKKTIPLLLTSALLFVGCGDDTKPTPEERTTEQLLARISELEEENRTLKQQVGTQEEPVANEEIVQPAQEPQEETPEVEESQSSDEPESANSDVQYIQSQPGNTQEANYFKLLGKNGSYKQTGDAFIVNSEYGEEKILVVPIQFTNLSEEASDPWVSFVFEYQAFQEDDVQEYTLNGGQGAVPEEYENPLNMNIKQAKSVDYYLTFTLEKDGVDIKFKDPWNNEEKAILKFQ